MAKKFRAVGHHIFIKPLKVEKTKSGLIIQDDDTDPVGRGLIVSVGESVDPAVKEGMVLIYEHGREWEIDVEGEQLAYVEDQYALMVCDLDYYNKHVGFA